MGKTYSLALITGGSSGIGLAIAKDLVREGTNVCLLAQNEDKLEKAKKQLEELALHDKQMIDTISCDITDFDRLSQSLQNWISSTGTPDLVINSAGITYPGYFQDLDVDIFHHLMNVNYFGTLHVLKFLLPIMIEKGSGTVVNISSLAGIIGVFGYTGYSASKFAVRGFSDALRAEMKPLGIQVSIVFPPDTQTPQLEFEEPLKPMETKKLSGKANILSAENVAAVILKNIKRGKYVIIPGLEGKFLYRMVNLLGNLTYPLIDRMIKSAQKNK